MSSRVWCEHCDGEFSETGRVSGREKQPPTDGDGRPYKKRGSDFLVPTGKRNDYLMGNVCIHCMKSLEAMDRDG